MLLSVHFEFNRLLSSKFKYMYLEVVSSGYRIHVISNFGLKRVNKVFSIGILLLLFHSALLKVYTVIALGIF